MNKQCFQVILSKTQQQFVVVSELVKSAGKSSTVPKEKVDDLFALQYENLFGKKVVTLSDGSKQTVLAPRVYVVARKGDVDGTGSLLGGGQVDLQNIAEIQNSGTIYGRDVARLNAGYIENRGKISGNLTALSAEKLHNLGGVIEGEQATLVNAKEMMLRSTAKSSEVNLDGYSRTQTNLNRQALIHTKNADGVLSLSGGNLTMEGAKVQNDGNGVTDIQFTGDIQLNGLSVGFDEKLGAGNHYRNQSENSTIVSQITGNGQVQLRGGNIYTEGADLDTKGKLIALAENDLVLGTATRQTAYEEFHKMKSGSAVSSKTTKQYDNEQALTHKGAELTGEGIVLQAGNDIQGESLLAVSRTGDIDLIAGNNVTLSTATNQLYEQHIKETKRSGLLNGGEIGFTIGSQKIRQENTLDGAIQSTARNTLASESGNVVVEASNKATASNVDVMAANDKVATISGKNGVKVEAGKDVIHTTDNYEFSQSGLSIALSTPVTDAIQSAQQSLQKAKSTENAKLKGVYAVKAAEDAIIAAQNAQKVADTLSNLGNTLTENTAAAENPAVKISISLGTQKQERESKTDTVTHAKSKLNGGNVNILSESGKVELVGVDAKVKDTLLLDGKDGIISKGVTDTSDNKTTDKNHSASVGVFVGFNGDSYGIGIEAAASVGKGKENSHSEIWQNNQLQAGKIVTNSANGKLTLDATNVKGERWEADAQALDVISRQDVTKYDSKHTQAGGSVSVTYGSGGGATFNAAYNSAKLNTAQVENQTSIDIGKGGMDVKIHNNTHLDGAIITSEASQENNRFETGTLTTSDIQNYSELKTKSVAISGGSGGVNPMSALSLLGNKNESEQSTTKAAVGENINIVITNDENANTTLNNLNRDTENANQKVTKHDLNKARETQELIKGIGEISDKAMQIYTHNEREKIEQAKLELGKAKSQNASKGEIGKLQAKLDRLQQDYDKNYGTGSPTKRAVDAVTAALQGLAAKDVNQAIVGLTSPLLNAEIKERTKGNTEANLIAHALLGAVEAAATGNNALAGAVAGAGSEAVAKLITETLYQGKTTEQLTEAEKQNVVFLSQLAGGLAAGLIGDSTQSAAVGADIGKRAVENNYLSVDKAKERFEIEQRIKLGIAKEADLVRKQELDREDIANNQRVIEACKGDITNSGCQSAVAEAIVIQNGYNQIYPTETWRNYSDILVSDYHKFNELLYDKTGVALDFEQRAQLVAKGKGISIEEARTQLKYLDRYHMTMGGVATFVGAKYLPSISSAGKSLDKLGDFSKGVTKGANANEKLPVVGKSIGYEEQNVTLFNELTSSGIKFTKDSVVSISKLSNGKIVFLEKGNSNSGLEHILKRHGEEFYQKGIPKDEIPQILIKALEQNKVIGYQGKGNGRPIYEVNFNGNKYNIAITVGNNGYIVGCQFNKHL